MRKILLFLFFAAVHTVSAQEFSVKKGMVVDSLKVSDTLDESYALYIPTAFQGQKAWPVLLIFDAEGRGKSAANLFRSAAEEQGYILVSSNDINPENTLVENVEVGARLLRHVSQSLPVDFRQVSTAGSMEGAKVATSIPVIFDNLLGVLAVGSQWVNIDLMDRKKNFAFIGVVGDEQYSALAMDLTAEALEKFGIFSQIYNYEGAEEWPQPDLVASALGSLTVQAMKKRLRPLDQELVRQLYARDLLRADRLISNGKFVQAYDFLELLQDKYQGLEDLSEVEQKQNQVERSRSFDQQRRELAQVYEKENRLLNDFLYYFGEDVKNSHFENLGWWNFQKVRLDSIAEAGGAQGKMASRIKGFVSEMVESKREELEKNNAPLENKLFANMLQTIFDPQNFEAYKNIITLSAQDNDFSTALFYLEEMLKHGYRDKEALYDIEGTLGLRLTPEFNQIIENYLGSARFYDNTN